MHLCGELLAHMAGLKLTHIPYKRAAQPYADLASGRIDFMFLGTTAVVPLVSASKVRALAVTSPRRSTPLPDVPSMEELGLHCYKVVAWNGISAPARTPRPILEKIHADLVKVIGSADFAQYLRKTGSDAVASTPEQFSAFFRNEVDKWAAVIKSAGIKPE